MVRATIRIMEAPVYERHVAQSVDDALSDTRVVLIAGPRQSGKTTLAQAIGADRMQFLTLDDATARAAAQTDPVGFVRGLDHAVIDEVQRAPDLLLAIKATVDADRRPGRFLLTGSANLMTLPKVADSLAGRMEVVRLLPLSQAEIRGARSTFLANAFAGEPPTVGETVLGDDLVEAVLAGGYPEALTRARWSRRQDWYEDYVDAIVRRDVRDVAQIEQLVVMPRLLSVLAEHSGQLVNASGIGSAVGLTHHTARRYLGVFESLFLLQTIPPWFTNRLKRLTKSPKLHFLDAGLLAALRGVTPDVVRRDRTAFGAILETFVVGEVQKIAAWSAPRARVSHFRDRAGTEVDLVLENRRGEVVGIEVKASATVKADDFAGLRKLAEACGERFVQGLVLHDHDQVVPFGERMFAAPLSSLWSAT